MLATFVLLTALCQPAAALEIKRISSATARSLLVSQQHKLPMVTAAIAFDAGSRRDPKGKEGLAHLTAGSPDGRDQHDLTADEFNQKVDFMGSSIDIDAGSDYSTARLYVAQEILARHAAICSPAC